MKQALTYAGRRSSKRNVLTFLTSHCVTELRGCQLERVRSRNAAWEWRFPSCLAVRGSMRSPRVREQ